AGEWRLHISNPNERSIGSLVRSSWSHGSERCGELDEMWNGIFRRSASRERGVHARLFGLVDHAGSFRYCAHLVESRPKEGLDRNPVLYRWKSLHVRAPGIFPAR